MHFAVKRKVEHDNNNNWINNLSQAATLWRGRNSVFRIFFSTHLYARCNNIWKEPEGKTHNSKQRQGYKCFGSGKVVTCQNIHCKCCHSDLTMNNKNSNNVDKFGNVIEPVVTGGRIGQRGGGGGLTSHPFPDSGLLLSGCHFFLFFDSRYHIIWQNFIPLLSFLPAW